MRKLITRLGLGVLVVAALTLVGAPSAYAIEANVLPPKQVDNCGTANDYFQTTNPALVHTYETNPDGTITATAAPAEGYTFPEGAVTSWVFPAFSSGCITVTDLPAPSQIDNCGPEVKWSSYLYWSIPSVPGVSYSVQRFNDGSGFRVVVNPRPGYVIEGVREWIFPPFTNTPC